MMTTSRDSKRLLNTQHWLPDNGNALKNVSIVGFGDILKGDLGIGCYVIDALCQEPLNDGVELTYLAESLHYAGAYLCDAEFAVIVGALWVGGCAGDVHCWDRATFQQNTSWLVESSISMRLLAQALARTELSLHAPDDILFLLIEPRMTEGFGISSEMRRALRKTVSIIKANLFRRGFLSEIAYKLASIYQLQVLHTTV